MVPCALEIMQSFIASEGKLKTDDVIEEVWNAKRNTTIQILKSHRNTWSGVSLRLMAVHVTTAVSKQPLKTYLMCRFLVCSTLKCSLTASTWQEAAGTLVPSKIMRPEHEIQDVLDSVMTSLLQRVQ